MMGGSGVKPESHLWTLLGLRSRGFLILSIYNFVADGDHAVSRFSTIVADRNHTELLFLVGQSLCCHSRLHSGLFGPERFVVSLDILELLVDICRICSETPTEWEPQKQTFT